jgi:predicted DNA-binding protein with PD1-like motif
MNANTVTAVADPALIQRLSADRADAERVRGEVTDALGLLPDAAPAGWASPAQSAYETALAETRSELIALGGDLARLEALLDAVVARLHTGGGS